MKLIFIDNDNAKTAAVDLDRVKRNLIYIGNIDESLVNNIEVVCDFSTLGDKAYSIVFDTNHICCTWSMFTATHFGSLQQLFRFLRTAGQCDVKGVTHIDCSGQMLKTLRRDIRDVKNGAADILAAIERNCIITISDDWKEFRRIRVDLLADGYIVSEPIDLNNIIS